MGPRFKSQERNSLKPGHTIKRSTEGRVEKTGTFGRPVERGTLKISLSYVRYAERGEGVPGTLSAGGGYTCKTPWTGGEKVFEKKPR